MEVRKEHFIDAGEQDANGLYDYYYEDDVYHVSIGERQFTWRSYIDTPHQLAFIHYRENGKDKPFVAALYDDPNFIACIKHFYAELEFEEFLVPSSSGNSPYMPIDLEELPGFPTLRP